MCKTNLFKAKSRIGAAVSDVIEADSGMLFYLQWKESLVGFIQVNADIIYV